MLKWHANNEGGYFYVTNDMEWTQEAFKLAGSVVKSPRTLARTENSNVG